MRSRLADFVALLLLATSVHAAPIDTNVYFLDLSGKGTLTDVFASGLRPQRWDSSIDDECFVEDKFLKFKIPGADPVTTYATYCVFKVYATGSLASIQAQSPNLSLDVARKWMTPIFKAFKGSTDELESYLKLASTGDRQIEQRLRAGGGESGLSIGTDWPGSETDLPALSATLQWRWDKQLPIAMTVMITWARKYSEMRYLAEPLHSPPGYEQFPIITEPYVAEALRKPSPPSPPLPPSESVSTSGPAVSRPERAKH